MIWTIATFEREIMLERQVEGIGISKADIESACPTFIEHW
ncbi:hypothetical protein [Aeromonas sp. LsrichE-8G]